MTDNEGLTEARNPSRFIVYGIIAGIIFDIIVFLIYMPHPLGGTSMYTATGFTKFKPQFSKTGVLQTGEVKAVFTNGVGKNITIRRIKVLDDIYPERSCSLTQDMLNPSYVAAGYNTVFSTAPGCVKERGPGSMYKVNVSIEYEVDDVGASGMRMESGELMGET
jgi:hypothetical protein